MTSFFIPYPPSVNSYWGFNGHRRFLTPEAVEFKNQVKIAILEAGVKHFGDARLEITITLYPKDKRVRDLDNSLKSCLDAIGQSGLVFKDDSQIDVLLVQRGEIVKGGQALIEIKKLSPHKI
jgi:crossover junction endodeoxyribonuclease RusA